MTENQETMTESHTARVSSNYVNAQTVIMSVLLPTEQLHELLVLTTTIHCV